MNRIQKNKKSPLGAILDSIVQNPSGIETKSASGGRMHHSIQNRKPSGRMHPYAERHGRSLDNAQRRGPAPASHSPHSPHAPHAPHAIKHGKSASKPNRSGTFQHKIGRDRPTPGAGGHTTTKPQVKDMIPPPKEGVVRIIPLGGVEEIGKNMTAIEIGEDIIVIDAGMHFSTEDTPGIDYVIPNTRYLEERAHKIRGLIITHGHLDHTGGVPLVLSRIGNPKVYTRNLTMLMLKKRQAEFPHLPPLDVEVVEKGQTIMLGGIKVRFWGVTHTIPDSMGVIIETPYGWIVNPGDYKLDHVDGVATDDEEKEYSIFNDAKVLLLMTDSTNIENEGFSLPEFKVHLGLEALIKKATGRLIIAAFASHITRLMRVVQIAEELGKKIILDGRSMKTNVEVAIEADLLKPKPGTIIPIEEVDSYPPNKIIILMTGAQGEEFASLNRAANKSHKKFRLQKGDTIILSASIIPGNERAVEKMKDGLTRQGVKIISYRTPGEDHVHATGHGNKEDVKWLHKKVNARYFIPIHGNHYRLELHKELAMELGMPEENVVVPDNGSVIEITDGGTKIGVRKEKAPAGPMMVDGFSIGDMQDVVIRDRQMLAEDGMFVVVATIDTDTGKLRKSPDIISRGFVYLKESQELLNQARHIVKKTIEDSMRDNVHPTNFEYVKTTLGDSLSKFLYQKTAKRPLVIPVLLSV